MLSITCPVTGSQQLLGITAVVSLVNHRDHIALTVACPCGGIHVHRTGRRWQRTEEPAARRAPTLVPA